MRTQQGFYKNKSPQNIHIINSNYYNAFKKNNYNNFISNNKMNTFYNINYNNNRKSNNEYNYSSKKLNTENNEKFLLKSHNYFSRDYKPINNTQRRKDYTILSNKNPNKTNFNFYSPKNKINHYFDNLNLNSKNNLSTLPAIKTGLPLIEKQSQIKQINNNFKNNNFNNISQNNKTISKLNDLNKFINKNSNSLDKTKNNNNRYLQTSNFSSPAKINLIRNIKFNRSNNNSNFSPSLNFLLKEKFLLYKDAKYSDKSFDKICAYGVNTYKGIIRNYNEDRISVVVNAKYNSQKMKKINSPKVSYFGVYDGHAGNKCCEFLKNNLHYYIFESNFFPEDPVKAIEEGFDICENKFIESIQIKNINTKFRNKINQIECSGSCAIIILIIDDMCYTINLGDSRALYSSDSGKIFYQLSRDHKPNDPIEKNRIYKAGGSIFKTNIEQYGIKAKESDLDFKVPFRILPGRLAVSKYKFIIIIIIGCKSFWRY